MKLACGILEGMTLDVPISLALTVPGFLDPLDFRLRKSKNLNRKPITPPYCPSLRCADSFFRSSSSRSVELLVNNAKK